MLGSVKVRAVVVVTIVVVLGLGCSLDLLDPADVELSDLPLPVEVMGFAVAEEGARDGHVAIVWVREDEGEAPGFNVYRTDGTSPYQRVNDDLVIGHRYDDEGIEIPAGAQYVYVVTAVDDNGRETEPSNGVVVPANLSVEAVDGLWPSGESDIAVVPTFSWNEVQGAESYHVVVEKQGGGGPPEWSYRDSTISVVFGEADGTTYFWPSGGQLEYGTHYTWTVRAIGDGSFAFGEGTTWFTTEAADTVPPEPPVDIVAWLRIEGAPRQTSVQLAWFVDDPSGVFGCNVYRRIGGGEFERINGGLVMPASGGVWMYQDELGEVPYEELAYYTTVVSSGGESVPSALAVVPADPAGESIGGLSPPDDQTGVPVLPTFSWDAVPGAETYIITLREDLWEFWKDRWIYRGTGTSFECGETPGVTYLSLEGGVLQSDMLHSWQVVGVDESNFVFAVSEVNAFTTGGRAEPSPAPSR
jgi:hypothetical protein